MKVPAQQIFACTLALALASLGNGCSSFNREWKHAAGPSATNSVEGRWEGKWLSDANHHNGSLRCVLKRETDSRYQAHFKATYWGIFRASYRVEFTGEWREGVWQFKGEENLGWVAGGVYHYEGRLTPANFHSTYRCQYDHGTFELSRPQ